jgi:hypothetical protein
VAIEMQEQHLARERELDNREGALAAWEDDLVAFECTLRRVRMEFDGKCDRAEAVRQDYQARLHASTIDYRCSFNFDQVLMGH